YSPPEIDWPNLAVKNIFPSPYLARAALLYAFKEDEAAISECRQALRIMPQSAKAYHILGKISLRRKLYAQARENLHAAYVLSPRSPAIMVDLGVTLKYFGETKKTLNLFKETLRLLPDYARAHYQLAALYLEDADGLYGAAAALDKAERELNKASALNAVLAGQDKEQALEITEKIRQIKR
ncbi:MAG: hypothetical protein Q8O22_04410, partial [Candidatus Omnitrophota bacterium]|nr:hypothetical protein [Candidatus Omnitrophota bacterium]